MNKKLWEASKQLKNNSNLFKFEKFISNKYNKNFSKNFEKIHKFGLIKYSAGGLRDFSRIAASNEIMWRDIFFNNKKNISKAIDLFVKNLNSFKKDINSKNNKSILKKLIQTKKVRTKIIKLKQDVDKPDFGRS